MAPTSATPGADQPIIRFCPSEKVSEKVNTRVKVSVRVKVSAKVR